MTSYVFTHATVLDGTEGMEPQPNMTVVVNEGIIEKVGPAATTVGPFDAREIDLAGAYLAPGLVNLHVHLCGSGKPTSAGAAGDLIDKVVGNPLGRWYLRRTLRATGATKRWLPVDAGSRSAQGSTERASYRDAFLELGDALVAFCVLEAVIGLLNSFMLGSSVQFAGSGTVSAAGTLIGIFAFCVVVFVVQRIPRVSTVFRVLMPAIASLLVFLPFLGETYNLFFSTVLLGGYYFIALLLTYVVAEVARERRISPYVLMAAASGAARVCLAVALLGGQAAGSLAGGLFGESEHTMRFLVIIMAVIYVLSLAVVLISRDRRRRRDAEDAQAVEPAPREALPVDASGGEALLERRCALLAARGDLTEREAEILGYLARGRTKAHIAGVLFVSENTVRSHVRNIYSKLGVHTRQQLIDALEAEE